MNDMIQGDLFSSVLEHKQITKPIRLIECFAGIGSQFKALKQLTKNVESYKIVEWSVNSIKAYNAIHIKDFNDYSKELTKEDLIKAINGVSANYNEPLSEEQLNKKPIEWLKDMYNNCRATHNLINIMNVHGKDLEIVDTDKYDYILTYSFPCQDLSLAGLRKGMDKSQADGGTRSGLLWEVERILDELDSKPQILVMENVPEVIGTANIENFKKWELKLESIGYTNYVKIINAKDFGIPQNRRRCFMISILGEYAYDFPINMKLKYKLKDMLEPKVDEKYYISKKMINCMINTKFNACKLEAKMLDKEGCAKTIVALYNEAPKVLMDNSTYGNKALNETLNKNEIKNISSIDAYNKTTNEETIHTIRTTVNSSNETFIAIPESTKKGYAEAHDGDGVYINRPHQKRGTVQKGIIQSLTTCVNSDLGVCVKDSYVGTYQYSKSDNFMQGKSRFKESKEVSDAILTEPKEGVVIKKEKLDCEDDSLIQVGTMKGGKWDKINESARRVYSEKGLCPTLNTCSGGNLEPKIASEMPRLVGGVSDKKWGSQYHQQDRVYDANGIAMCHPASIPDGSYKYQMSDLRIRKLTPKECYRLMGFQDSDYQACADIGQSNATIYHQAGDSIVVCVLIALFAPMFSEISKHKEIISKYVEEIKHERD